MTIILTRRRALSLFAASPFLIARSALADKSAEAYVEKIGRDVLRVAKTYVDVDHLAIVIVGDRATIEGPLKATGIAPITLLDDFGNPGSTP